LREKERNRERERKRERNREKKRETESYRLVTKLEKYNFPLNVTA